MSLCYFYTDFWGNKCWVDSSCVTRSSDGCWYDQYGHRCTQSLDGYVQGTAGGDLIDTNYTGDPQGDRIDHFDAVLGNVKSNDDIVLAYGGNDTVLAGEGNDTVYGGDGNDSVNGGNGNDNLQGEAGNDTLVGGAGANVLYGGAGDDRFVGGAGADTFFGGTGQDNLDYSASGSGVTVTLSNGALSGGDAANDNIGAGIDGVIGSNFADSLTGFDQEGTDPSDRFTNQFWGNGGNDTIKGLAGNDLIYGGKDQDLLYGGSGDDTVSGDEGNDTILGDAGNDSLSGGDDRDLFQGVTAGDVVDGGEGGDDLDTLDLRGLGPVNVIYDPKNPENGTVQFLSSWGGSVTGTMTFTNIENLLQDHPPLDGYVDGTAGNDLIDTGYTGDPQGDRIDANDAILPGANPNDDNVRAGDGDDTVRSGEGNDLVSGGNGNDSLDGGTGDDTLMGEAGNDTLVGGNGNDSLDGGRGNDSLSGGDGRDTLVGGDGNDVIDSGSGEQRPDIGYPGLYSADTDPNNDRDLVYGGAGDDTIRTGDDADSIYGGSGNDSIDAGVDNDTVYGDDGNDTIIGGEGSDTIDGGAGNDLVYGGYGPNVPDAVNIPDATDKAPNNGLDLIHGGAGDDTIFGMDDRDTLYGDAGNDVLHGGIDDDKLYGGEGNDQLDGDEGNDTLYADAGNDSLFGGDDRDVFVGADAGDVIDGNEGGDDYDTLDLSGAGPLKIIYDSTNPENGTVQFLDADRNVTGTMTFKNIENVIPCFTPGTLIATPRGEVPVESLQPGDRIITRDNGMQEIAWVGRRDMSWSDLIAAPHLKPVLVRAGSLGNGLPERDMLVSPNHRLLVANDRTALYFDEHEVLVAAKHLTSVKGVQAVDAAGVSYIHFMCARHEVVLSNGAWTETFQPGDQTLKGMGNAQRSEIFELFPELKTDAGVESYQSARKTLKRHEAALLMR